MAVSEGYKEYRVRPWPPSQANSRQIFRILLSPSNLAMHKFSAGDVCNIETTSGSLKPAVVWPVSATEKPKEDIVQISKALQKLYGLELGCRILISRSAQSVMDASDVVLYSFSGDESEISLPSLDESARFHWAWLLEYALEMAEFLAPGMVLSRIEGRGETRTFKVQEVNLSTDCKLYRAQKRCNVRVVTDPIVAATDAEKKRGQTLIVPNEDVGGLDKQIQEVNNIVAMYSDSNDSKSNMPAFFQPRQGGILLHGARGTGKSMVLKKISEAGWRRVFHIDSSAISQRVVQSEIAITQTFSDALRCQPSVIIMDSLDSIASKQDYQDLGRAITVGQLLSRELERLENTRTLAIGAVRNLMDIHQDLRGAGRFELEIEIVIPDSSSRAEILKILTGLPKNGRHSTLDGIAARTHGFVGADLKKLLGQAVKARDIRTRAYGPDYEQNISMEVTSEALLHDMREDFDNALLKVRPTAMQEVFVETPDIRWIDIGGQQRVKEALEEAIVWPIKYPEAMDRHGLNPKKGLLLYGPPGCSKTMTAKAAATESGLNFIAVRGPELMSMYVGESERAIREVFSKARAVSPSILFFDEIDAIGATGENGQQNSVNTVTTLLNELDGFQELKGVFVLAATNRPDKLDPALIRAGRLDTTIYVGLPDLAARHEILIMRMRTMYLSDDIDIVALSQATEGFSGAEITSVCQKAGYVAMREEMTTGEKQKVGQVHFNVAMAQVEKSITPEIIKRYEAWAAGRH
ncbi:hypothetical protein N7G274_000496 [Stereocaulon virgatum]|uniref:AAA+ ATPase domain-containing protein n=1 Tax=Stereocaulon virgatum TaxID=373712 RepID=A0ABR4ASA8_9LECA